MDRVLSYQTASRLDQDPGDQGDVGVGGGGHGGFDIRQYISKRTCTSLTLSIAFITLILGFLLGKFTSDRHHLVREKFRIQNEVKPMSELENVYKLYVTSTANLSSEFEETYLKNYKQINDQFKVNFTSCISNSFSNTDTNTSSNHLTDFLKALVKNEFNNFLSCSKKLNLYLDNLDQE